MRMLTCVFLWRNLFLLISIEFSIITVIYSNNNLLTTRKKNEIIASDSSDLVIVGRNDLMRFTVRDFLHRIVYFLLLCRHVTGFLLRESPLTYSKEEYVAYVYNRNWWLGKITDVSQDHEDCYVHFLHPHGPTLTYIWPDHPDLCWIPFVWNCRELGACNDKLGLEAILSLHQRLDDDANGNIDIEESDDFLRDELKYSNSYERQKGFHRNDKHITADELWLLWKASEVHNWTVDETVTWLESNVELPQYAKNFMDNEIDGTALPRMAMNTMHFLSNLGIKDPIHKQKISLKAMDVVLFGPSKNHRYLKDTLLILSLIIGTGGCWFAYIQHKKAQSHLKKTMKDMDSLQNAEASLCELQKELDKAKQEQEMVATEKKNLEQKFQNEIRTIKQSESSASSGGLSRVQELEQKLKIVLEDLHAAEKALQERQWVRAPALQHWLQLTYELELQHYNAKKAAAEQQLAAAKEGCEKLRKKRSSFLGTFRVAHGNSIDDVDNRIMQAKAALSEVTNDLQERLHRWKQIEILSGFSIVHNPGKRNLESMLGGSSVGSMYSSKTSIASRFPRTNSEGTLADDDSVTSFPAGISAIQHLVHNSATLFLAPVPTTPLTYFTSQAMQSYASSNSPYSDESNTLSYASQPTDHCYSNEPFYGSLASIPHSVNQRPASNFCTNEEHFVSKASAADLKPCASSNAILQRSDALCYEHSDSYTAECENFDEKISIPSAVSGTDSSRPIFTVGESNKDGNTLIVNPLVPTGLKRRTVEFPVNSKLPNKDTFSQETD